VHPDYKTTPQHGVEEGNTSLPDTHRQHIREALHDITSHRNGDVVSYSIVVPGGGATPLQTNPTTTQLLIAIIQRFDQGTPPLAIQGHDRNHHGPDPLLEAIIRLREHGIIIRPDGKVVWTTPPPPASPPSWQGRLSVPTHPHRPELNPPPEGRDAPQKAEPRREGAVSEDSRALPPETPSEQRIREVFERAISRFHDRYNDRINDRTGDRTAEVVGAPERASNPLLPDRLGQGAQGTPRFLDPERASRPQETIVSPSIREAINDTRNDTARLLQQLLAHDSTPARPPTLTIPEEWATTHIAPPLNQSLVEARASILERLPQLRDALQTTLERSSPQPQTSIDRVVSPSQALLQAGDFSKIERLTYEVRPQSILQSADRSAPKDMQAISSVPTLRDILTNRPPIEGLRPGGHREESSRHGEKASAVLDALSKAAGTILSLQTLRRIDAAAETAVLTAAAAIALGVMGSEIVLKEILALSEEFLRRLRGERSPEEGAEKLELEKAVRELEKECADRGVETIAQPAGLVADIPGTVRDAATDLPLEGIEIDGGPLGTTYTNARGEFIFTNVPLDQGFVIRAKSQTLSFFPDPAIGTVSATTNLSVTARPR